MTRCAGIVGSAPINAEGLDFYAGMDEETRLGWEHALEGGHPLVEDYQEFVDWPGAGMPDLVLPDELMVMLRSAFEEARRPGPGGYVDDAEAFARDWRFSLSDIRAPGRLMFAREDTSIPFAHVQWLREHIPGAEVA